jgi:hypothetical protein
MSAGAISAMGLPVTVSAAATSKVGSPSVASHLVTSGIANGKYVISTAATECGLDAGDVNGQDLVIAGTRATVKTDTGEAFVGAVTRHGSSFKATTKLSGSTFSIVFTGTTARADTVKGTYLYSGVPGGTNGGGEGVSCTYAFIGNWQVPSVGKCTLAALRAGILKSQRHYVGSYFKCIGSYAVVSHLPIQSNGEEIDVAPFLLHWKGTVWSQVLNESVICANGDPSDVPAAVIQMACVS